MDRSDVPLEHTPPTAERDSMTTATEWNFEVRDNGVIREVRLVSLDVVPVVVLLVIAAMAGSR